MSFSRFSRRLWAALLPAAVIVLGLAPIWMVKYVPLYDYPTHLLEAQVVLRYHDPAWAYAPDYQLHEGWYLRSNALTALLMMALGQAMPMDIAGRLTLSLYVVLMTTGLAALLASQGQPRWLLLALPIFLYNLTFTAGLLNWSYGLALLLWAVLTYLRWRQRSDGWALALLALLMLLIYLAHLLAWGLGLLILCLVAAVDGLPQRRYPWFAAALFTAMPLLAITRPLLALAPPAIVVAVQGLALVIRRYRLRPWAVAFWAGGAVLLYIIGVKATGEWRRALESEIGYSQYAKLVAGLRLFPLPQHGLPIWWEIVGYNLVLLSLLCVIGILLALSTFAYYRTRPVEDWRWLTALGVLLLCFLVIPTRTADIVATEPRVVLLGCVLGLLAVRPPSPDSRTGRMLVVLNALLFGLASAAILAYARQYDASARTWARTLARIPPAQRVLVLAEPLVIPPGVPYDLLRVAQIFDALQFSSTYALEHGGFISNTFFNGPLLPRQPEVIPLYLQVDFKNAEFVRERCARLRPAYDYVLVWNAADPAFIQTLEDCYGEPLNHEGPIHIWKSSP